MRTLVLTAKQAFRSCRPAFAYAGNYIDQPYDLPDAEEPHDDSDETLEPDDFTFDHDDEDEQWNVFVPEEDEVDVEPDPRDFGGGWHDAWDDDD
jgi:hypothetical protein